MSRRIAVLVSFVIPPGATREGAKAYVLDAVGSYKGGLKPPYCMVDGIDFGDPDDPDGDPMFNLDTDTIVVRDRWRKK